MHNEKKWIYSQDEGCSQTEKSQYTFKMSFRLCFLFKIFRVYWLWKGKIACRLERPINTPIKGSLQLTRQAREEKESVSGENAFIMVRTLRPRTFCRDTSHKKEPGSPYMLGDVGGNDMPIFASNLYAVWARDLHVLCY